MATNTDRVLDYLRLIAPKRATNEQIVSHTGIRPHTQVFQITRRLFEEGSIQAIRSGREWEFWVENKSRSRPAASLETRIATNAVPSASVSALAREFEVSASRAMSGYYGCELRPGEVVGVPKRFDLVSDDRSFVGDAKFFTMVQGQGAPPAKFSIIAEHVWLLEKTRAKTQFLVFGNDRRVPEQWLKRYQHLAGNVSFFFLATDGALDKLR